MVGKGTRNVLNDKYKGKVTGQFVYLGNNNLFICSKTGGLAIVYDSSTQNIQGLEQIIVVWYTIFERSLKLKNKYLYHSKVDEKKFRQILRLFVLDLTASQTAELTSLNIKTINRLYGKFCERIKDMTNEISPIKGEYEADESYFGLCRVWFNVTIPDKKSRIFIKPLYIFQFFL